MPLFWASFNNAHTRIQSGGWARQVTQADFAISDTIADVNMRLDEGGIREMHWHRQSERAVVTNGTTRITVLDKLGRPQVADVGPGGLWFFPPGLPHSLQGVGTGGTEFILAFDDGRSSEFNTLLLTDWLAHTPTNVLAKNFNVPADSFRKVCPWTTSGSSRARSPVRWPSTRPQHRATRRGRRCPTCSTWAAWRRTSRTRAAASGSPTRPDFPASTTTAAALVTVHPGGMREMHWHPNADEWQYYVRGQARMTVFNTAPQAVTADFRPGDIGYIRKSLGHYVENTGPDDLVFLEISVPTATRRSR